MKILSNRSLHVWSVVLAGLALVSIVFWILFGMEAIRRFNDVDASWQKYNSQAIAQTTSLNKLRGAIGYGGYIHNFKNYVLRAEPGYLEATAANVKSLNQELADLRRLLQSPEEQKAIAVIQDTFDLYEQKINLALDAGLGHDPIRMDQMVRVDDGPALKAFGVILNTLETRSALQGKIAHQKLQDALSFLKWGALIAVLLAAGTAGMIVLMRALEQAKDAAQAASRAKSEFLSAMSHELRTPLNGILGFAQMLELSSADPLTPRQKECVDIILSSGKHLLELVDQVLDLEQIEGGAMTVVLETVHLDEISSESMEMLAEAAQEYEVTLSRTSGASHPIIADRTRFRQVVLNLLSNAIKYNRPGGSVTISYADCANEKVRISIVDTGEGIELSKQPHIFEAFNRLGREAGAIEGTGIGLTVTKQLVEMMGGRIGFESVPGTGSTFWVEMPSAPASASGS